MSEVKTNKNEKYLGKGIYQVEPMNIEIKGKNYSDKLKHAIQAFLSIKTNKLEGSKAK